jgi:hypothetical protein
MATEFALDDYILVLDGRVLEVFYRAASESRRYHVTFLGVDMKPHGNEFKVHFGARHRNDIINGSRLKMNQEQFARFDEFIALAIAARDVTS